MTNDTAQSRLLGQVEVLRVIEWQGPFTPTTDLVPDAPAALWRDNQDWLAPDHWRPDTDHSVVALQTWVLRSGGRTILIDTGVGDGRERPGSAPFHHWQGDLLGRLAHAGIHPDDVDIVINTHLHFDHVGWNTVERDGQWTPTFPHAQYLIPAADDAHFGPADDYGAGRQKHGRAVYQECVAPLHQSGQAVLWEGQHRVDENLTLEAAPGHTPGSCVLRLASGGERAVFVGDLLHSPVQILHPGCSSAMCVDPAQSAASRRRILHRAADERELLVPAHFAGSGAVWVRREGDQLSIGDWAAS